MLFWLICSKGCTHGHRRRHWNTLVCYSCLHRGRGGNVQHWRGPGGEGENPPRSDWEARLACRPATLEQSWGLWLGHVDVLQPSPSQPWYWQVRPELCLLTSHLIFPLPRFLMNGKAVCLMSVQMFSNRVPLGGKLLYRDFQIRLAKALYKKWNIYDEYKYTCDIE